MRLKKLVSVTVVSEFSYKNKRMIERLCTPNKGLVLVIALYLFFGLNHLGQFVTADEGRWLYERIPNYWEAVHDQKWKKTFINDKPGVSVALAGLPGVLLNPEAREHCQEGEDKIIHCNVEHSENFLLAFRLPLVLVNAVLLCILFFVIGRLINPWAGLWSSAFIGLSPPLIGISQIVNPDAFLWSFGSVATFTFFLSLKTKERKWALLAGFFLGMALLSKYVALILYPFYFGVVILGFFLSSETEAHKTLRTQLKLWGIQGGVAFITTCFFLPAFLTSPKYYLGKYLFSIEHKGLFALLAGIPLLFVFGDIFLLKGKGLDFLKRRLVWLRSCFALIVVALGGVLLVTILVRRIFPAWEIFKSLPFDVKELTTATQYGVHLNFFEAALLEWSPLAFSLTPIVLIGIGGLCVYAWKKRGAEEMIWVGVLSFFAFLYLGVLMITDVFTTIRYSIILYPFMGFLGAMGFWYLSERVQYKQKYIAITAVIVGASLLSLFWIKPFYFNYTSSLLSKESIMSDAWGYGGYEAAQYLNGLPGAQNITVWADYYGVCEFFVGRCVTAYTFDQNVVEPNYYVLTRRGNIRYGSRFETWERISGMTASKHYADTHPEWQLFIDGHPGNYIKIIKVPIEDAQRL